MFCVVRFWFFYFRLTAQQHVFTCGSWMVYIHKIIYRTYIFNIILSKSMVFYSPSYTNGDHRKRKKNKYIHFVFILKCCINSFKCVTPEWKEVFDKKKKINIFCVSLRVLKWNLQFKLKWVSINNVHIFFCNFRIYWRKCWKLKRFKIFFF